MTSSIKVLKFGGSSLATPDHIRRVAEQIVDYRRRGSDLLVVASAMGPTTADLLSLAGEITDDPPLRELDKLLATGEWASTSLLCMELTRLGVSAISLTGAECGIRTNDRHFDAAIERVDTRRIRREFDAGRVVVAAGFQGIGRNGEVTTLGLGGSDITAVVLAGALDAVRCEICSDVDGVYSADPRVVGDARRIEEISYDEMVELARHGAAVLNPRAVEHARSHGVEIHARSTFEPRSPGTLIRDVRLDEPRVVGVASHRALVSVGFDENESPSRSAAERVLAALDDDAVFADHHCRRTGLRNILIPAERVPDAGAFAADLSSRFGSHLEVGEGCSSVSAIGLGVGRIRAAPGALKTCSERAEVRFVRDFAGEHSMTCLVRPDHADKLMNAVHDGFEHALGAAA